MDSILNYGSMEQTYATMIRMILSENGTFYLRYYFRSLRIRYRNISGESLNTGFFASGALRNTKYIVV